MIDVGGLHTVETPPDRTHPRPSSKHIGDIYLPQRVKGQARTDRRWGRSGYKAEEEGVFALEGQRTASG